MSELGLKSLIRVKKYVSYRGEDSTQYPSTELQSQSA
jgi:hypothetical protein